MLDRGPGATLITWTQPFGSQLDGQPESEVRHFEDATINLLYSLIQDLGVIHSWKQQCLDRGIIMTTYKTVQQQQGHVHRSHFHESGGKQVSDGSPSVHMDPRQRHPLITERSKAEVWAWLHASNLQKRDRKAKRTHVQSAMTEDYLKLIQTNRVKLHPRFYSSTGAELSQ